GDTLTTGQASAFGAATAIWGSLLSDNVTVTLQVGFTSLGGSTLAQTASSGLFVSTAGLLAHLAADATSANDAIAVAHLPSVFAVGAANVVVTSATARALGYA